MPKNIPIPYHEFKYFCKNILSEIVPESMSERYTFIEKILFPSFPYGRIPILFHKTILITGASFGIGESFIKSIAQENVHLILIARTEDKLSELKHVIESKGGTAEFFSCDLRNETQRLELIRYLVTKDIDIFIHNAGHSIYRKIEDSFERYHDVERLIQLHYHAPIQLLLSLLPKLIARKAHIIHISAVNVLLPSMPGWSAYQSSKVAFDQWFQSVAVELRKKGMTFSALYFPLVKTRMVAPNRKYDAFPKMSSDHAALIICDVILHKKRTFAPWWMIFTRWINLIPRNWMEKLIRIK